MTMEIGKYTYGGPPNVRFHHIDNVKIGKFCSIADNLNIFLRANHNTNWVTTYPFGHINQHVFNNFNGEGHPSSRGDVIIGNDVWIGSSVTIMSGVKIGDGAVLAANSHVIKDVEPYSLVGGNPAKHIKYRFSEEQIKKLLEIKWWDWDDEKINRFTPYMCSDNIDRFIEMALAESGEIAAEQES